MNLWTLIAPLTILLSGCAASNSVAICDGSESLRKAHATALLTDGGLRSQDTGEALLTALQAGCNA